MRAALRNWRILVLIILATVTYVALISETDNLIPFLAVKGGAFALAYICYRLYKRWDAKGLIDELNQL